MDKNEQQTERMLAAQRLEIERERVLATKPLKMEKLESWPRNGVRENAD